MAGPTIGELAAGITLDTSRFDQGIVATRGEVREASKIVEAAAGPLDRYADQINKIENALAKGTINQSTHNKAMASAKHDAAIAGGGLGAITARINAISPATIAAGAGLAALGAAAAVAGAAIYNAAEQAGEVDRIGESAAAIGVSTEFLSGMEYAAERSGVSIETLGAGLNKFTLALGNGSKGLEAIGLDIEDLQRMKPEAAFLKTIDALNKIENPTQRAAAAFKIFGKSAIEMQGLITAGVDEIADKMEQAGRLRLIVDGGDAERIGDMLDAVDDVKDAWAGAGRTMAAEFAPVITRIAQDMVGMVESGGKLDGAFKAASVSASLLEQNWENAKTAAELYMQTFEEWTLLYRKIAEIGGFLDFGGIGKNDFANYPTQQEMDRQRAQESGAGAGDALDGVGDKLAEAAEKIADDVATPGEKLQERLDHLADLFHAGALDVEIYNRAIEKAQEDFAKASGATEAAEKAARVREKLEDNIRKGEEKIAADAEKDADRIREANKSPLDKLREEAERMADLLDSGNISWDDYTKGANRIADQMRKLQETDLIDPAAVQKRINGATTSVEKGSAEANRLEFAQRNPQIKTQIDLQIQMLNEARKTNKALGNLAQPTVSVGP